MKNLKRLFQMCFLLPTKNASDDRYRYRWSRNERNMIDFDINVDIIIIIIIDDDY